MPEAQKGLFVWKSRQYGFPRPGINVQSMAFSLVWVTEQTPENSLALYSGPVQSASHLASSYTFQESWTEECYPRIQ